MLSEVEIPFLADFSVMDVRFRRNANIGPSLGE